MSVPTTPSALHALFVFNPDLGEEATEARKLLYFFDNRPDTVHRIQQGDTHYVDLNYQKDLCGIAEGLIAFTREFSPDSLCESVHCQQHRYAFAQPEKSYWMVLVVKNPTIVTKEPPAAGSKKDAPSTLHTEYLEDELEDSVLQAILHRCYSLFSLFNSSFTSIVQSTLDLGGGSGSPTALSVAHDSLRVRLSLFMSYFLPTIRFSQLIYFTDIHGFQFLPVDKITFLTIQYIIHLLTLNFTHGAATTLPPPPTAPSSLPPSAAAAAAAAAASLSSQVSGGLIKNVALMYNSKLIYSGLHSEIMFLLYSLDQDLMYWFLMEYLTEKEKLAMEIQRGVRERARIEAEQAAAAKEAAAAGKAAPAPLKAWQTRRPAAIAGVYNVPESAYERNGRLATNRKAFDRAQNKGEVGPEEDFVEEADEASTGPDAQQGGPNGSMNEDDILLLESGVSRASVSAGATAAPAPFGYMTGPFRVSNAPSTGGGAAAATLPGAHVSNCAPCINSPLIYLDGLDSLPQPGGAGGAGLHGGRAGAYGSGNPSLESNPAFASFPGAVSSDPSAPAKPLRLVVYQKYKITLFLIVEDQEPMTAAKPKAAAEGAAASASSSAPSPSPALLPRPPLSFYSALESFMESNLKKLGEMLFEQTVRLSSAGGVVGGVPVEEPYRFLYFNHMNLALKTSLSSSAPAAPSLSSSKGGHANGSAGSVLTMETIKIIRELHRDFNTVSFRQKRIAALSPSSPAPVPPPHLAHSIAHEGSTEVCVKTKHHGWVIGRRATQSHREFFLLLEDKVGNLADIQEEVETLSRTYFYNIFIH